LPRSLDYNDIGMDVRKNICFCVSAEQAPTVPGAYVLKIGLKTAIHVILAGRSPIKLSAGRYLYCGSAYGPGGLRARLTSHWRRQKSLRWHVDQLTARGITMGAWVVPSGDECDLVRMLSDLPTPITGFGSSDCKICRSHLLRWPEGVSLWRVAKR